MSRTEESRKREEALANYQFFFQQYNKPLPPDWEEKFLKMWNSATHQPIELAETPPCGWVEFNRVLGGVPWCGAWSHEIE